MLTWKSQENKTYVYHNFKRVLFKKQTEKHHDSLEELQML